MDSLAILNTHPATQERIDRLQALRQEMQTQGNYYDFNFDFQQFQNTLTLYIETQNVESQDIDSQK